MKTLIKRFDIILQFVVSAQRPIVFTIAIATLRDEIAFKEMITFIGYIGLFAIVDAIFQSYARVLHLHSGQRPKSSIASTSGMLLSAVALLILYQLDAPFLIYLLTILFIVNSHLLIHERLLSQRRCILITYGFESVIGAFAALLLISDVRSDLVVLLAFASYPISRIFGVSFVYLIDRNRQAADRSKDQFEISASLARGGSTKYVIFSVGQQIVSAVTASTPVIFYSFVADYDLFTDAMILLRWVHTIGGLAAIIVNVLGARIFYRSIDVAFFVRVAHRIEANRGSLRMIASALFLVALTILTLQPQGALWASLACAAIIIAGVNFLSSLLLSFGRPGLTFSCQLVVLGMSCFATASCFSSVAAGYIFLLLSFAGFSYIYAALMKACQEIS